MGQRAWMGLVAVLGFGGPVGCDATAFLDEPSQVLDLGAEATAEDDDPAMIQGADGAYYLTFLSTRGGEKRIWITRSADGVSWTAPELVSERTGDDTEDAYPSLVEASPGRFHVVYTRRFRTPPFPSQIVSRRLERTRDDTAWMMSAELAATPAGSDGRDGRLVLVDGRLLLVFSSAELSRTSWRDKPAYNRDVFAADWIGSAWSTPRLIRAVSAADRSDVFPDVAVTAPNQLALVWQRQRTDTDQIGTDPTSDIWIAFSADRGATWADPVPITDNLRDGAPAKGEVHAVPRLVRSTELPTWFVAWTTNAYSPAGGFVSVALGREREYPARALNASTAPNPGFRGWLLSTAPASAETTLMVWASNNPVGEARPLRLWRAVAGH